MTEGPTPDDTDSYHGYSVDEENQPQDTEDSQTDRRGLSEPLDEGYSPPEKWSVAEGFGNTPLEEELGETLDQRIAQEEPEADPYDVAAAEADDPDNGVFDSEVGNVRAGRLVEDDDVPGLEQDFLADDVGIDGAGASAEEAAMHVIDDDEEF
ncbi:DUF5709 domain-containing protein [Nocardioides sp.]|uniref:DUF5709 domain-containing protein n=1 Tax=Nocardioides sp. TaxID=35761 RepID=UPI0031FE833A|nr:hypothetical protein [Nocardioides sp.]